MLTCKIKLWWETIERRAKTHAVGFNVPPDQPVTLLKFWQHYVLQNAIQGITGWTPNI